ncbi:hypothetical protein AVEN_52159-1, partial [Araneus ventricosus]
MDEGKCSSGENRRDDQTGVSPILLRPGRSHRFRQPVLSLDPHRRHLRNIRSRHPVGQGARCPQWGVPSDNREQGIHAGPGPGHVKAGPPPARLRRRSGLRQGEGQHDAGGAEGDPQEDSRERIRNVERPFQPLIAGITDGKKAWQILKENFESTSRARLAGLIDEFFELNYNAEEETIGVYCKRVLDKEEFTVKNIEPQLINEFGRVQQKRKNELHRTNVANAYETRISRNAEDGKSLGTRSGFILELVNGSKTSYQPVCFRCSTLGHIWRNCHQKIPSSKNCRRIEGKGQLFKSSLSHYFPSRPVLGAVQIL